MSDRRHYVPSAIAEGVGYTIVENASLEGRNTFRVPARANLLIDVRKTEALAELFGYAMLKTQPVLVLGEGSNILFTRDWPGVVLSIAALGITVMEERADSSIVRVEAGENWNDFVHWSLTRGYSGLENLVLIPGTVGAAPIQNIGAYGVEVSEFIATVEVWDRETGALSRLSGAECRFGYRDSVFKHLRDRYIITSVEFNLPRHRPIQIDYAGVREELAAIGIESPAPPGVAEAIARIRTRKLPNPALVGNAGSFFKNPLVDVSTMTRLRARFPQLPAWEAGDGRYKLSAAWMIESCGFKGLRQDHAAVSELHSLVLINLGKASGSHIWALAERIQQGVKKQFEVMLEPEPLVH